MTPIPDAISLVRPALYAALCPLTAAYNGHPRCYWLVAEQGAPLPLLVVQSQDGGGADASLLGLGGWAGLITVKALASSLAAAETLLAGVPAAMAALAAPEDFTIRATFVRPLVLPPADGVWQAGQIYRVQLYRS